MSRHCVYQLLVAWQLWANLNLICARRWIQETSFTCDGLVMGGYYADPEQDCQAYHVCLQVKWKNIN